MSTEVTFDVLFRDLFNAHSRFGSISEIKIPHPVDIYEHSDGLVFEIACTGLSKDEVDIDIELDVLKGASRVLSEIKPKAIILEWNWHQLFRGGTLLQIQELLPDYQAFRVLPYKKGLYPVDTTRPEENICHYSNYVFVRSDLVRKFLQD